MSRFAAGLLVVVVALAAGLALLPGERAAAEGFTVTRLDDPVPDGCDVDGCSLREAIMAANESVGPDSITLGDGIFPIEIPIPALDEDDDTDASGDFDIRGDLAIVGSGAAVTVVDGGSPPQCTGSVFEVHGDVSVTIQNATIRNGCADNSLGERGGGLRSVDPGADVTLLRVVVRENFADRGGGGLYVLGTLRVTDSLLQANTVASDEGLAAFAGRLVVENTTVSGHSGGVALEARELTLISSTVTNNDSGIRLRDEMSGVTLRNSIIAGNARNVDCNFVTVDGVELRGRTTSLGHNIDSDGGCELTDATDLPSADPELGPLQHNGGPTWTHALTAGSVALDRVPASDCINSEGAPLTTDQRGTARPQGSGCDIGAFERIVSTTPPPGGNGGGGGGGGGGAASPTPTPTPTPTPIVGAGAPPPTPVLELRGFAPRGVALWVLIGSAPMADLIASLADAGADPNGCTVASLVAGQWVVLIPGALDQRVNAAWQAAFPGGVSDGTPLWSRCRQ